MNGFVLDFFKANDVKYSENYPMSRLTPIRIGGCCEIAAFPDTEKKLIAVVKFLSQNKILYKTVGKMSNILPTDERYPGVIVTTESFRTLTPLVRGVRMSAGMTLRGAYPFLLEAGFSGYEELLGIPGTIGGLVVGNAGAFGRETSDLVASVRAIELDTLEETILKPSELEFSYRSSRFKKSGYLILESFFEFSQSDKEKIKARIAECRIKRAETQPIRYPSLGSTFKRYKDISAAKLIDECGLKGQRVGGAVISNKHAGFIINDSGATEKDVKELINKVGNTVFDRYGVRLEREIEYLGE